jgi:hypothetical protein
MQWSNIANVDYGALPADVNMMREAHETRVMTTTGQLPHEMWPGEPAWRNHADFHEDNGSSSRASYMCGSATSRGARAHTP